MKCPNCKKEIEELDFDVTATCKSQISKEEIEAKESHGFNILDYDVDCLTDGAEFDNFACIECGEVLAFSEEDAIKLLKESK